MPYSWQITYIPLFPTRPILPINFHIFKAVEDVLEFRTPSCAPLHFLHRPVQPVRLVRQ